MTHSAIREPFYIGSLQLPNRLIQGPLAGYSAAPMRRLYYQYTPPAYTVSEMTSAHDVLHKHRIDSRYLYRAPEETRLCYQIAGDDPLTMAKAAKKLEDLGADLIDINCGCPKTKIRKKGAGSALLSNPNQLSQIISAVRETLQIPFTVKIRIQNHPEEDLILAQTIEKSGADALIVHGRHWTDDYHIACNYERIRYIKNNINIPVIANGDISDSFTLSHAMTNSSCDAYMIARAGCGQPWLYEHLLYLQHSSINLQQRLEAFFDHFKGIALLEGDYSAMMQSRSFIRYYFRDLLENSMLYHFYTLTSLSDIEKYMRTII